MTDPFSLLEVLHKVKRERSSPPTKSSSQILSELFEKFNAEPPQIQEAQDKKHKKKRKHKERKKKKKPDKRGRSSSDDTEDDEEPIKKKSKKSKHKKRKKKHKSSDSESETDSEKYAKRLAKALKYGDSGKETFRMKDDELDRKIIVEKGNFSIQVRNEQSNKESSSYNDRIMEDIPIPKTPDVSQIKLPEEAKNASKTTSNINEVKANEKQDKTKMGNKIQIKNLKFSSVFEATVKQVEEEARKRAERYEDGEISDSSISNASFKDMSDDSSLEKSKTTDLRDKLNDLRSTESEKYKINSNNSKCEKSSSSKKSKKSRSRSKGRSSSKSKKRSRSRSRKRSDSKTRKRGGSRSTSRGRSHKRSRSRSRHRHYSSSKHGKERDDRRYSRYDRRRSSERDSRIEIDKKRLLEIARKNAINMLQSGALPAAINLGPVAQQKVISAIKSGGKSVDELTDFCKSLSRQEALGELSSVSSDSDNSGHEESRPFNHPFQVKDKAPIVMNIKGGTAIPTQSLQEKTVEQSKVLRMQFPVSSGTQHRGAESEWRPVSPPPATSTAKPVILSPLPKHVPNPPIVKPQKQAPQQPPLPSQQAEPPQPPPPPLPPVVPPGPTFIPPLPPTPVPGIAQPPVVPAILPGPQIFPESHLNIDIGTIVSQRLTAIRKLQQNPNDVSAMNQMYQVNQEMSKWAQSKQEPGQFTGSTGAQILTPRELASGYQAWAKKDQLQTAAPVSGGMGMHLLQKMGWRPGEGLGKEKNGALTPLLLEVKLDTKGLVAKEECVKPFDSQNKRPNVRRGPTVKTLAGKHPVSLLGEYCSKRKLGVPAYQLCFECGPDHKKNFVFKVTVNGIEYQPNVASANKKQAKADAAQLCLQKLGLVPS